MLQVLGASVESPSLKKSDVGGPAYELKFLLDEAKAQEVEAWCSRLLALDPHGDPNLGGAYRTTSLYCDTPEHDVYHRSVGYRARKFRIRRYDAMSSVFLERKTKRGDRVSKRRSLIPDHELPQLTHPMSLVDWTGHWFHRSLLLRRLVPACRIAYRRTAFVGSCRESPLRVTLDRHLHGLPAHDWMLAEVDGGLPLLPGKVILELKFLFALPTPFKELVAEKRLTPTAVSKYRLFREAWGVPISREAVNG